MADHKDGVEMSLRARRTMKQAHCMSIAALVLGAASVGLLAAAGLRGRGGLDQVAASGAIGLSAVPAAAAREEPVKGWYRTRLRSMVRKDEDLASAPITILPEGTYVWVEEGRGRRARVAHPVEGWCSLRTEDGLEILQRDESKEEADEVGALLAKDKKFAQAQQRLQDVQKKLVAAKARLQANLEELKRSKVTKAVVNGAKDVAAEAPALEHQALDGVQHLLSRDVKRPEEAKKLLGSFLGQTGVKGAVEQAEAQATAATQGVADRMAHTSLGQKLEGEVEARARAQYQELSHEALH